MRPIRVASDQFLRAIFQRRFLVFALRGEPFQTSFAVAFPLGNRGVLRSQEGEGVRKEGDGGEGEKRRKKEEKKKEKRREKKKEKKKEKKRKEKRRKKRKKEKKKKEQTKKKEQKKEGKKKWSAVVDSHICHALFQKERC